jgi:hypothetical protein
MISSNIVWPLLVVERELSRVVLLFTEATEGANIHHVIHQLLDDLTSFTSFRMSRGLLKSSFRVLDIVSRSDMGEERE